MSDDDLQLDNDEARVDALLRSMNAGDLDLQSPPDSVWAGIESSLATTDEPVETLAPVIDLASRRRAPLLIGAVAAALVVIAGLALVLVSDTDSGPIEVASAELVYVPDSDAFVPLGAGRTADVTLIEEDDTESVRVDSADLPAAPEGNDLEIWLIAFAGDEAEIVPLGIVEDPNAPGTFALPDDFDRSAYDSIAVDISVEPQDGVEAHSGMSLVRGALTA